MRPLWKTGWKSPVFHPSAGDNHLTRGYFTHSHFQGCNTEPTRETNTDVTLVPTDFERLFDDLLSRNLGRISAIARVYGQGQTDDLLQEILLRIWQSLPRFRGESALETWCYRVALNTAITWTRTEQRRGNATINLADHSQIPGHLDGHDPLNLLQRFLGTLNEFDRGLVLMYLEDLTSRQMGEVLNLSEGAVRVRLHRIKEKLSQWDALDHESR